MISLPATKGNEASHVLQSMVELGACIYYITLLSGQANIFGGECCLKVLMRKSAYFPDPDNKTQINRKSYY